jgi:peptide/nickel transport system permease protein
LPEARITYLGEVSLMGRYLAKRLLSVVPTVFGISLVVFLSVHLIPGDAVDVLLGTSQTPEAAKALRELFGLDRPLYEQYAIWLGGVLHGDFGTSLRTGQPVLHMIAVRFPTTLELTIAAMLVCLVIAIPAGVIAAVKQNSPVDYALSFFAFLGLSTPSFWLGTLLIILFAIVIPVLPPAGFVSLREDPVQNLKSLILPALTLGTALSAVVMRMTRASLIEVIRQDYVKTARAKGLREQTVVLRHALKNAFIPVLTTIGLQAGYLLGGAVVIEQVFSWPGVGRLTLDAVLQRDYPLVQGTVMLFALCFVLINIVVDLLYAVLNPQIHYR